MIRKLATRVLQAGLIDVPNAEERNKVLVTTHFSLASVVFLVMVGLDNLLSQHRPPALIHLSAAVIITFNCLYLHVTKNHVRTALFFRRYFTAILFVTRAALVHDCTGEDRWQKPDCQDTR